MNLPPQKKNVHQMTGTIKSTLAALALMALAAGAGASAQTKNAAITVSAVGTDADEANGGFVYALPQTVIRFRVEAEVTQRKVGPFYRYSKKYLNIDNVITDDETQWQLKSVSIGTRGTADRNRRFRVAVTGGAAMPVFGLTADGVLASVGSVPMPAGRHLDAAPADASEPDLAELDFDDVPLDNSVLTKTSTAAMAEETAFAIYRIRQQRMSLLNGEAQSHLPDAESYATVLGRLDEVERQYVSLFAGKEVRQTVVRYFELVPDRFTPASTVLFRFSTQKGFLDVMDLNGTPVYADVTIHNDQRLSELPAMSKQRKQSPLTGLRYVLPGRVTVKVIDRNIPMAEATVDCAQTGQVATLSPAMTAPGLVLRFDTTTGAMLTVGMEPQSDAKKK